MKTVWFKGYKDADKEQRKKEILSYRNAFEALSEILEQELTKTAERDYGPGWAEKQIALNERNHAISEVLDLININKEY